MFKRTLKILFATVCYLTTWLALADNQVEGFFRGLEGKWQGEVKGIYKIDMEVSAFSASQPWQLQKGTIKIIEGGEQKYEFELSKNQSALDNEVVYFLRVKNLSENEAHTYTLSSRAKSSSPLSFWRHFVTTQSGAEYRSANALKIFKSGDELTLGFVSGNGYCTEMGQTSQCATDGWTPYLMKMVAP